MNPILVDLEPFVFKMAFYALFGIAFLGLGLLLYAISRDDLTPRW